MYFAVRRTHTRTSKTVSHALAQAPQFFSDRTRTCTRTFFIKISLNSKKCEWTLIFYIILPCFNKPKKSGHLFFLESLWILLWNPLWIPLGSPWFPLDSFGSLKNSINNHLIMHSPLAGRGSIFRIIKIKMVFRKCWPLFGGPLGILKIEKQTNIIIHVLRT